jgi:hypothetical protein
VHHEVALISTIAVGLLYALIGGYFASRLHLTAPRRLSCGWRSARAVYARFCR